jgi:hypothetical protein
VFRTLDTGDRGGIEHSRVGLWFFGQQRFFFGDYAFHTLALLAFGFFPESPKDIRAVLAGLLGVKVECSLTSSLEAAWLSFGKALINCSSAS